MLKKHISFLTIMFVFIVTAYSAQINGEYGAGIIDTVRLSDRDIPEGFMFGLIPNSVKSTLHDNPWDFDEAAIKRLTPVIYPDGDASAVGSIHFTILTHKEVPYGDDIVCYLLMYKSSSAADREIGKIREFAEINKDRVHFSVHDNIVVLMMVDDVSDYPLMRTLCDTIDSRFPKK